MRVFSGIQAPGPVSQIDDAFVFDVSLPPHGEAGVPDEVDLPDPGGPLVDVPEPDGEPTVDDELADLLDSLPAAAEASGGLSTARGGPPPAPRGPSDGSGVVGWLDEFGSARPSDPGGGNGKKGGEEEEPSGDGLLSSYTSGGNANSSYNVKVEFNGGGWTVALQDDFIAAADFISSIILADVSNVRVPGLGRVDDIVIRSEIVNIDGEGGILGRAGPTSYRTSNYLPASAIMEFDGADAETYDAAGLFDDIVLHEMLHSIGFGTMWDLMGLVSDFSGDLRFTGSLATERYKTDFATYANGDPLADEGVPVETDGGPGTAGGHWDDATFGNELMTGYINGSNYLSEMSIAALEDMGYDTVIDDPNDDGDLSGSLLLA